MTKRDKDGPAITAHPRPLPRDPAAGFDAPAAAKVLLRTARSGALATHDPESGFPLVTLVNVAADADGAPLLLISALALHTRNLAHDGRAALLLTETGKGDALAHPRLSLVGICAPFPAPAARRRFLARHPKAARYADLPDFAVWRMGVQAAHLNGGFGKAAALSATQLCTETAGAEALVAAEPEVLATLRAEHAADIRLLATARAGAPQRDWVATGCDPEGLDLACGDYAARLVFAERVTTAAALFAHVAALAAAARGQ